MRIAMTVGLGILISTASVLAQDALVGKYTGHFMAKADTGDRAVGVSLEIISVEGEMVKAKANRAAFGNRGPGVHCSGDYEMEGTLKDNKLDLRSTKGGRAPDCTMRWRLVAEGKTLKGKFGERDIELSK